MKKPEYEYHITDAGTKIWILRGAFGGVFHCENGPAVEWADGAKAWYLNDECYCSTYWDSPCDFAKGLIRWIEAVKKLRGKK